MSTLTFELFHQHERSAFEPFLVACVSATCGGVEAASSATVFSPGTCVAAASGGIGISTPWMFRVLLDGAWPQLEAACLISWLFLLAAFGAFTSPVYRV